MGGVILHRFLTHKTKKKKNNHIDVILDFIDHCLTDLSLDIGINIEKYGVPQVKSQYHENMILWDLALALTFNCP